MIDKAALRRCSEDDVVIQNVVSLTTEAARDHHDLGGRSTTTGVVCILDRMGLHRPAAGLEAQLAHVQLGTEVH